MDSQGKFLVPLGVFWVAVGTLLGSLPCAVAGAVVLGHVLQDDYPPLEEQNKHD
jgi:hypothetical protein